MMVTAPKTEHHPGKGKRLVPIFGDLRPWLDEAFEAAPKGRGVRRRSEVSTVGQFADWMAKLQPADHV